VGTIDWEKCKQDLSGMFPEVKLELETRIAALFDGNYKPEVFSEKYPPRIEVSLAANYDPIPNEIMKRREQLARIISDVAAKNGFKVVLGILNKDHRDYSRLIKRRVRDFIPAREFLGYSYTLKPDYKRYIVALPAQIH